jgi:DNA primase
MADQVEEIKQKTDIVSVISEHVDLKKAGRNYKALCPFHSEKTPSFMVTPELQIYKCFGCNESGDAYAFLQKYEGMDFYEALKYLADRAGVKLKQTVFKDREGKQGLYELNSLAAKFYQYILLKHKEGERALNYLLKNRKLKLDTIKTFQLGYAPERSYAITKYLLEKKGFTRRDLDKSGMTYARGGRPEDRFRGRVIFPLFDHRGNTSGFAGRLMPENSNSGLAKYINTPETPVYHKSSLLYGLNETRKNIKKGNLAVVMEGELDAISSWQIGIKNVVAIKGSALTEDQARLLGRFANKVVLALDADIAGDKAARRGITIAEEAGMEVSVASLGDYKDPDEMALKAPKDLKLSIKNPVGVWDFIIDSVFAQQEAATGTGKAKISRELIPVLASIADKIVQAHYAEMVSKKLGVSLSAVVEQIEKTEIKGKTQRLRTEQLVKPETKTRRELLEERLLGIAFALDAKILLEKQASSLIKTSLARRITTAYKRFTKDKKSFDPSQFAEGLPRELVEGFADILLFDSLKPNESPSDKRKELEVVKREIQILDIKDQLELMAEEIKKYEKSSRKSRLKGAEKKFAKLTQTLSSLEEKDLGSIIL